MFAKKKKVTPRTTNRSGSHWPTVAVWWGNEQVPIAPEGREPLGLADSPIQAPIVTTYSGCSPRKDTKWWGEKALTRISRRGKQRVGG